MILKGYKLPLLGLFLGFLVGVAVISVKALLVEELIASIQDEAKQACNCQLTYDSTSLSLLERKLVVRNVRLEERGNVKLQFDKLIGNFDLSKILSRQVNLDLHLLKGYSDGFDEESATYKFIDHLSLPIPPEHDRPTRIKVQLQHLYLREARAWQRFPRGEILGEGIEMDVVRTPDNNFQMTPHITELAIHLRDQNGNLNTISLGEISSTILFLDDTTDFSNLRLRKGESFLAINSSARKHQQNSITGSLSFGLNSRDVPLPSMFSFGIEGNGALNGTLSHPSSIGAFNLTGTAPLSLTLSPKAPPFAFSTVEGSYSLVTNDDTILFRIPAFKIANDAVEITAAEPLTIGASGLTGKLHALIQSFHFGDLSITDGDISILLGKDSASKKITVAGDLSQVSIGGLSLPHAHLELTSGDKVLEAAFRAGDSASPTVQLESTIRFAGTALLEKLSYQLNELPLSLFHLSGKGNLHGALSRDKLSGEGVLSVAAPAPFQDLVLAGPLFIKDGKVKILLDNKEKGLSTDFSGDLSGNGVANLVMDARNVAITTFVPDAKCGHIEGKFQYAFDLNNVDLGNGKISLSQIEVGCPPYQVTLEKPRSLPISGGVLTLDGVTFKGEGTTMALKGSASSKNLTTSLNGALQLHVLSGILPGVDDVEGVLSASLTASGPPASPKFTGSGDLRGGLLTIESKDIAAEKLALHFELSPEGILLRNGTGTLNGGELHIDGMIVPLAIERSSISVRAHEVSLSPAQDVSLICSGDLALVRGPTGKATIKGAITIDHGEFQRELDLATIVKSIAKRLLSSLTARAASPGSPSSLPDIDLDISLKAPRNLFVVTNWAGAELAADLKVMGTINTPQIDGVIETLSGRFTIKDREFEITSGEIRFKSTSSEPTLSVLAETMVRAQTGDMVLVLLDANGSLTSPKVTISSDRGLSQQEIVTLLTSGGGGAEERTIANKGDVGLTLSNDSDEFDSPFLFRLFRRLTKLDALAIEPTYNNQTGIIEPTIIARKRLADRLTLVGQSSLGSSSSDSKVQVIYNLASRINLSGSLESTSAKQKNSLGADLTYTILADQAKLTRILFDGNKELSSDEILLGARINEGIFTRIGQTDIISKRILQLYNEEGYLSAKVAIVCNSDPVYCRTMRVSITEGPRYTIGSLQLIGAIPPPLTQEELLKKSDVTGTATRLTLSRIERSVIQRLRSEGFIGARVEANYGPPIPERGEVPLTISLSPGHPVTFTFVGNSLFSPEEFLGTINLLNRKQPFGSNTINILIQNIERLYREAGFLYATITSERRIALDGERLTYLISIDEGKRVPVSEVTLEGNATITQETLQSLIASNYGELYNDLWNPTYAVEERMQASVDALVHLYHEEGFPDVRINFSLLPHEASSSVEIHYTIFEGTPLRAQKFTLNGFPEIGTLPPLPAAPYSFPKVNRYIDALAELLRSNGYFAPELSTELNSDSNELTVFCIPGPRIMIKSIAIEGLSTIDKSVIEKALLVKVGSPWNESLIDESKKRLFTRGLFSRVSIGPKDGSLDSENEDLVVSVTERALTTLEVGSGANSEYGLHLFGEAVDKTLFSDGRSLSLRIDSYYDSASANISQGIATFRYADPSAFGTDYALNEDLRYQKLDLSTQEFNLNRLSLSSVLNKSDEHGVTVSFGHTIEEDNLTDVSPDAILSSLDKGNVLLSFFSGTLNLDFRDNPVLPTSGSNFTFDYKLGSKGLGSDANFAELRGKAAVLAPIGKQFGLAASFSGGIADSFSGTNEIPITQRFYLGGRNSVRGFNENSLGPRGAQGAVIGGDATVSGSTEFRYFYSNSLQTHLFLDGGNVFLRDRSPSYSDLRYSSGLGFRYLSPIGPIGLDVGFPLDRKEGESAYRVHFDIGTNF